MSSSYSPSILSDVQMLCLPITVCLGRVSQLKLRIRERRRSTWALRPGPWGNGGRPGAGGGGGGGGGSGGGGGGGAGGPPGIFCQRPLRGFGMDSLPRQHVQAGLKPMKKCVAEYKMNDGFDRTATLPLCPRDFSRISKRMMQSVYRNAKGCGHSYNHSPHFLHTSHTSS